MILTMLSLAAFLAGLWKVFEKAGQAAWAALIPFYNLYIWLKVIDKPIWWFVFLLIPFINVFTLLLMVVETLKCFRRDGLIEQALAVMFPFVFIPFLGFSDREKYSHPSQIEAVKKTAAREWADAIIFAVIAALLIRTFMIEAYTIPTSSMEKSLLVGDYLFVSKLTYGPKVPTTPLAFPFAHNTLPLTQYTKSYLEWIRLPHYRYPAIRPVRNNDVVVFHYPDGDTVALQMQNQSYYTLVRDMGRENVWRNYDVVARPVDRRMNYIKRAVGVPGDTLKIRDGVIHVNGEALPDPPQVQHNYRVITDGSPITRRMLERFDIRDWQQLTANTYIMAMTREAAEQFNNLRTTHLVEQLIRQPGVGERHIFPHHPKFLWNEDQLGPLYIPRKDSRIELTTDNLPLYQRIIEVYEGNELEVRQGQIFINGEQVSGYTFQMDYYWMVGDNRHNSADSRFWGFVPEDHIVGRAMFVWLSLDRNRPFPRSIRLGQSLRVIR